MRDTNDLTLNSLFVGEQYTYLLPQKVRNVRNKLGLDNPSGIRSRKAISFPNNQNARYYLTGDSKDYFITTGGNSNSQVLDGESQLHLLGMNYKRVCALNKRVIMVEDLEGKEIITSCEFCGKLMWSYGSLECEHCRSKVYGRYFDTIDKPEIRSMSIGQSNRPKDQVISYFSRNMNLTSSTRSSTTRVSTVRFADDLYVLI